MLMRYKTSSGKLVGANHWINYTQKEILKKFKELGINTSKTEIARLHTNAVEKILDINTQK